MAKKLSYYDRKELLEAQQTGLSDTKLKEKFGIADRRTLYRHLKLAEQEEEAKAMRLEIVKDALAGHLEKISNLIGEWKDNLSTPGVAGIFEGMPPIPTQSIEAMPLFPSLRQHLPFPVLWRNYTNWKTKVLAYIEGCQKVLNEIRETGKGPVDEDVIKQWGTESITKAIGLSEPLKRMRDKYIEAVEADSDLKSLSEQLKSIEIKLHESLQEIQLRQDHIVYTCKLCPGQTRLLR